MKEYSILISEAMVHEWNSKDGAEMIGDIKQVDLKRVIYKESITRQDVINKVAELLGHTNEISTDDLYDGNEEYFTFSRIENAEGEELEKGVNEGYLVDYLIHVDLIQMVKAIDIQ